MARWWRARSRRSTYSVIGLVTDDGYTFCPAVALHGDVRDRLAGEDRPPAGSVVYVVHGAPDPYAATQQAIEDFEAEATEEIWERGQVRYI